ERDPTQPLNGRASTLTKAPPAEAYDAGGGGMLRGVTIGNLRTFAGQKFGKCASARRAVALLAVLLGSGVGCATAHAPGPPQAELQSGIRTGCIPPPKSFAIADRA